MYSETITTEQRNAVLRKEIIRKFRIFSGIRKANSYKRMAKATKEHRVIANLLE